MTVCPFCHSAGQEFPEADPEYSVDEAPSEQPSPSSDCGAGCGTCGHSSDSAEPDDDAPELVTRLMLTCPTCDEPFWPQYLKHCEWCGYEFPDGTEIEVRSSDVGRPGEPTDPLTPQAIATVVVLGLLAVGLLGWLLWVV
jgi:hypothetical protein